MRSPVAAILIALCLGCTDSSDVTGVDKENLSLRIDVTGDASLAPASFRLSLDGTNWLTAAGGEDRLLSVSPGNHTVGLKPFDNIIDLGWCLQLQPSSLGAVFTRNSVIYARFNVYCPSATGTGKLAMLVTGQSSRSITVVLTRIVGIPGSQTLTVPPGGGLETSLTAGLYRIETASPCRIVYPYQNGVPAIPVRNGETTKLTFTVSCVPSIFKLPPGIP